MSRGYMQLSGIAHFSSLEMPFLAFSKEQFPFKRVKRPERQTCCLTKPHSISSNSVASTKLHKPPTNFFPVSSRTLLPCSPLERLAQRQSPIRRTSGQRSVNKGTSHDKGSSWGSFLSNHCVTQA